MSLIEQEREHAIRSTAAAYQNLHRQYMDGFQKRYQKIQMIEAEKLSRCQHELIELRKRCDDLQNIKKTDEAKLHNLSMQNESLQQEYNLLTSKFISFTENRTAAFLAGGQAYHSTVVKELAKYGITFCGLNSISFGEPWLQLWDQYVFEDNNLDRISSEHRLSPKDLSCLVENFANQIRSYKDVQKLEDRVESLKNEQDHLVDLTGNDVKKLCDDIECRIIQHGIDHGPDHTETCQAYSPAISSTIKSEPGIPFPTVATQSSASNKQRSAEPS